MDAQLSHDQESDWANRRASPRHRTLKRATIVIGSGYSVFDCIIRNLSETGAMLAVEGLGVPSHFQLRLDAAVPSHQCTVRWRAERAVGVSFDDVRLAA